MSPAHIIFSLVERIRGNRVAHSTVSIILFLIEGAFSLFLYCFRVRFLRLTAPGRIGHLALEPDIYVKTRLLGLRPWYFGVLICPSGTAANGCLLDYWRSYFKVVDSPFWSAILNRLTRFSYLNYDVSRLIVVVNETAPYVAIKKSWGCRPPLLSLTDAHRQKGWATLARLGVPLDSKFICFHCREDGFSPSDEAILPFRSCSVENYLPAVIDLTKKGYWCIRMGDPSMRRIEPLDQVIDYAHLNERSDWMDVFLCASCQYFLGSASGLLYVASAFGTPCALANQIPLSALLAFNQNDVAIPKQMWSEVAQRNLTFKEAFNSNVANFQFGNPYLEHRLMPIENSAEDVRDLALELLDRTEGRAVYSLEDERLQQRFKALMRPGHYSYEGGARVGRDFLRKYASLLENAPDKI